MAVVKWGEKKKRYIEYGVSKGVLYPNGKKGVAWNGLISISESASGGEPIDLFADNMNYCSFRSLEFYEATIEAYTYPEEFEECDGTLEIANGIGIAQQRRLPFGLCFRSEIIDADGNIRNDGYKIHLIYNATASPTEKAYSTISDNPDAITFSWEIKTTPFVIKRNKASSTIVIDTTKADYLAVKALENILYGDDENDPRLPSPNEVTKILTNLNVKRIFMDVLSKEGKWVWDTFNFNVDTVPIAIDRESEKRVLFNPGQDTEYSAPSIAYTIIDEGVEKNKYMGILIDSVNPSDIDSDLHESLDLIDLGVTESDGLYYYKYNFYA